MQFGWRQCEGYTHVCGYTHALAMVWRAHLKQSAHAEEDGGVALSARGALSYQLLILPQHLACLSSLTDLHAEEEDWMVFIRKRPLPGGVSSVYCREDK